MCWEKTVLKRCVGHALGRARPGVSDPGATVGSVAGTRGNTGAGTAGQLLVRWEVTPPPRAAAAARPAPWSGLVIEHVDGAALCELGSGCEADVDAHDVGRCAPAPRAAAPTAGRCFAAATLRHRTGPGDGTGPLVCALGHDADDLDATEDTDRAGQRVYHPGHDAYPCAVPDCPRCTGALS